MSKITGFNPPPYPHDQLKDLAKVASVHDGGIINLSIGVPFDTPPSFTMNLLDNPEAARLYPPSTGTKEFCSAAADWLNKLSGTDINADMVKATVGSKEFVAGLPHWLKLRNPEKSKVLYPAVSYPTYAMGATLANCEPVPVALDENWCLDLATIKQSDIDQALCLWVNSPGNPSGAIDNLEAVVEWGRANNVLIVSDECYIEFIWDGKPDSALNYATDGVLAVHSLSKRSNFAGLRSGFYAGDPQLVHYLGEVRKHSGFMQPGPVMLAAIAAMQDSEHVEIQRDVYLKRLQLLQNVFEKMGIETDLPGGAFYLWLKSPQGNGWDFARKLAEDVGMLVSPGDFYGKQSADYIRVAAVQPEETIAPALNRI